MTMWIADLSLACNAINVQIASVCARSLFEHLLDLKWLILHPEAAESFHEFVVVRRYHIAKRIAAEFAHHKEIPPAVRSSIEVANNPNKRALADELCIKNGWVTSNGKPNVPMHWWGHSVEKRALAVDPLTRHYSGIYAMLYGWASSQVHPGGVGLVGISAEAIASLFVYLHFCAQDLFREATELTLERLSNSDELKKEFQTHFSNDSIIPGVAFGRSSPKS